MLRLTATNRTKRSDGSQNNAVLVRLQLAIISQQVSCAAFFNVPASAVACAGGEGSALSRTQRRRANAAAKKKEVAAEPAAARGNQRNEERK